jgi:hypothetical protein
LKLQAPFLTPTQIRGGKYQIEEKQKPKVKNNNKHNKVMENNKLERYLKKVTSCFALLSNSNFQ